MRSSVDRTLRPPAREHGDHRRYRRYLRSLLPLRDPVLRAALDRAIDTSPMLSKGPLLEASPAYQTGSTIRELVDDGVLNRRFLD